MVLIWSKSKWPLMGLTLWRSVWTFTSRPCLFFSLISVCSPVFFVSLSVQFGSVQFTSFTATLLLSWSPVFFCPWYWDLPAFLAAWILRFWYLRFFVSANLQTETVSLPIWWNILSCTACLSDVCILGPVNKLKIENSLLLLSALRFLQICKNKHFNLFGFPSTALDKRYELNWC